MHRVPVEAERRRALAGVADALALRDDRRNGVHGDVDGKEADLIAGRWRDAVPDHEREQSGDNVGPISETVRGGGEEGRSEDGRGQPTGSRPV